MSDRRCADGTTTRQQYSSSEEEVIIPLLSQRSCHLPGNDWRQDWIQYLRNNHIVFGICLCHPLHPLEWWERVMALLGSIAVGLIATNLAYLWDIGQQIDMNDQLLTVQFSNFVLTQGMVVLWTVGAIGHAVYDLVVWNVMACACCHPGGRWGDAKHASKVKDCGSYFMIPVVLALLVTAAVAVLRRAAGDGYNTDGDDDDDDDDDSASSILSTEFNGLQSFSFLSKYAIELALSWFVWFPLVGTLVFSGKLGCNGRLPILGGRPRDLQRFQERMAKEGGHVYASF